MMRVSIADRRLGTGGLVTLGTDGDVVDRNRHRHRRPAPATDSTAAPPTSPPTSPTPTTMVLDVAPLIEPGSVVCVSLGALEPSSCALTNSAEKCGTGNTTTVSFAACPAIDAVACTRYSSLRRRTRSGPSRGHVAFERHPSRCFEPLELLTPPAAGVRFDEPTEFGDAPESTLQQLKYLWHTLLAYGADAMRS